jgi:C-terminal processing protease CtpA/Prc
MLKKTPEQRTFGITVKGDCPVRINHVDPQSHAHQIGIREGSYIVEIQGHDVRWLKHSQVVERIRSYPHSVKLTLVNVRQFTQHMAPAVPILETAHQLKADMLNEIESIKTKNIETTAPLAPLQSKTIYSSYLNSTQTRDG